MGGNSITLGSGGVTMNVSGTNRINLNVALPSTTPFDVSDSAGILRLSSVVSNATGGTGGISKTGAGMLLLDGTADNPYTGPTTISAGTLAVTRNNLLGTIAAGTTVATGGILDLRNVNYAAAEALALNGGTLQVSTGTSSFAGTITLGAGTTSTINVAAGSTLTLTGQITGSGDLIINGGGTVIINNIPVNNYMGITTVSAGVLNIRTNTALGDPAGNTVVAATGAALEVQNDITVGEPLRINGTGIGANGALLNVSGNNVWNGTITLGTATSTIGVTAGNLTVNGQITETVTANLTKAGGGTLTLANASNNYGGVTNINAGTLTLGLAEVIPNGSAVVLAAGTTLNLNNNTEAIGSLRSLVVGAGTVQFGGGVIQNTFTVGGNNSSTEFSGTINGTSNATDDLVKTGTGTFTLASSNAGYQGLFTVNQDVLNVQHSNALGTAGPGQGTKVTGNGAALQVQGGISVGEPLTLNGTGVLNGGALQNVQDNNTWTGAITLATDSTIGVDNNQLTVSGAIGGTGALTKAGTGTLVLSNTGNTYGGATNINGGTLELGTDNVVPNGSAVTVTGTLNLNNQDETFASLAGGGTVTFGNGGTVNTLTVGDAISNTNFSGVIDNTSDTTDVFLKTGASTLRFSGNTANGFTGITTVEAGTLELGKTGVNAIVGDLNIGDGAGSAGSAVILWLADEQVANTSAVTVAADGLMNLNDQDETIASLVGGGTVQFGSPAINRLTVGTSSSTFGGSFNVTANVDDEVFKTGAGELTLTGASPSFPGDFIVNQGVLNIRNGQALGNDTGDTTVAIGAVLEVEGGTINVVSERLAINGDGIGGTGALLSVSGTNTWGGQIIISSTIGVTTGILTVTGQITEVPGPPLADLNKAGAGILILSNASNNWGGATNINGGTLRLGLANAIPNTGAANAVTVGGGATLDLNNQDETIVSLAGGGTVQFGGGGTPNTFTVGDSNNTNFAGVIDGTSDPTDNFVKTGTGVLEFSGNLANGFTGTITVNEGRLDLNKNGVDAIAGALVVGNSAEVRLLASNQIAATAVTVNSGGLLNVQSNTDIIGNLTVTGGTVQLIDNPGNLTVSSLTMTGGTVNTNSNGDASLGTLTLAGNVTTNPSASMATILGRLDLGAATRSFNITDGTAPDDLDISAAITGAGGFTQETGTGTLVFSGPGANDYAGATTVTAGILALNKTTPGVNAVPGNLTIGDGIGLDIVRLRANHQIVDTSVITIVSAIVPVINTPDINNTGWLDFAGHTDDIRSLKNSNPLLIGQVASASDVGPFTIRSAIDEANANDNTAGDVDTITIRPATQPPNVVVLATALPAITESVRIIGTLPITLDGNNVIGNGLHILNADGVTIQGITLQNFTGTGIVITGNDAVIQGNTISVQGAGIVINGNNNKIGQVSTTDVPVPPESTRNFILPGNGFGIVIASGVGNAILSNSIGGVLGIDLNGDGLFNVPDDKDPDDGANRLQNPPILTSNETSGTNAIIKGGINSLPGETFLIEFFSISSGELLGSRVVTTQADGTSAGRVSFSVALANAAGDEITATATLLDGNGLPVETSEFAESIPPGVTRFSSLLTLVRDEVRATATEVLLLPGATVLEVLSTALSTFNIQVSTPQTSASRDATSALPADDDIVIYGKVFKDINGDGIQDENEAGAMDEELYLDNNNNGRYDEGDTSVSTNKNGDYEFRNLRSDKPYVVRIKPRKDDPDDPQVIHPPAKFFEVYPSVRSQAKPRNFGVFIKKPPERPQGKSDSSTPQEQNGNTSPESLRAQNKGPAEQEGPVTSAAAIETGSAPPSTPAEKHGDSCRLSLWHYGATLGAFLVTRLPGWVVSRRRSENCRTTAQPERRQA